MNSLCVLGCDGDYCTNNYAVEFGNDLFMREILNALNVMIEEYIIAVGCETG